jgi:hypothetical protein
MKLEDPRPNALDWTRVLRQESTSTHSLLFPLIPLETYHPAQLLWQDQKTTNLIMNKLLYVNGKAVKEVTWATWINWLTTYTMSILKVGRKSIHVNGMTVLGKAWSTPARML